MLTKQDFDYIIFIDKGKTSNGYAKMFVLNNTPTLARGVLFLYGNY